MKKVLFPLWLSGAIGLFGLCVVLPGCHDALGPEKMPVATVDGRVSVKGRPLSKGWIEFIPVDGTVGRMRSARLRGDGTFHATKVPVGLNLIRLVNADYEPRLRFVFGAFASPIRRRISEQPGNKIEIDLIDEAVKYQNAQTKEAPLDQPDSRESR
jgi:hypothetical protein